MRHLFILSLLYAQIALAGPPSFWARVGSSKQEGLIALQEARYAYRHRDFDEALDQSRRAREIAPSIEADFIYGLSLLYANISTAGMERPCAEALTVLQSVQERSPSLSDDPELRLTIGLCAAVVGEFDVAIEENSLLAAHPNTDNTMRFLGYLNLGDSLMAVGELSAAIKSYQRAYRLSPGEPYVSFAIAVACYRNREYRNAAEALQRALSMDPDAESLRDGVVIFVPADDEYFFLAVAAAGNQETGLAHSLLGEYLAGAVEGSYRGIAMEAFWDVEVFSLRLNGFTP